MSQALVVINGLTTAFQAAPALAGVTVSKGWEILPIGTLEHVFVASDGGALLGNEDIARAGIEWPGVGTDPRTETGEVRCAASTWTGDQSDVDGQISRAYALVDACEDVLRADPSLSSVDAGLLVKITETRLRVIQDSEGFAAIVMFMVSFMASQ